MTWVSDNKDLISLAVAAVAVALSVLTVRAQRRQQGNDAFRHIHELLITPELQQGRRLAYIAGQTGTAPDVDSRDWYLANRSIVMFDTLATYYGRGLVPKKLVLEVWHHAVRDIRMGAQVLAQHRGAATNPWAPWPHLLLLVADAEAYKSKLACCTPSLKERAGQPRTTALQLQGTAADPAETSDQNEAHRA